MKKRIFLTLIGLVALIAVLGGIKALQIRKMMGARSHFVQPPEPVTTAKVTSESWETVLPSIGSLTAVQGVTVATRSIGVQATLPNSEELLRPGMFVNIEVVLPKLQTVLSVPSTAALYAPFGDSVFIVEEKQPEDGKKHLALRQQFIRLGRKRGDFVSVLSGLREGEGVVTTGVFKLLNGQAETELRCHQGPVRDKLQGGPGAPRSAAGGRGADH